MGILEVYRRYLESFLNVAAQRVLLNNLLNKENE